MRPTPAEIRERCCKPRDAWWTVFLVDPVAVHLVRLVAPYRWVTPNLITVIAFAIGLAAAACFATITATGLIAGALLFHTSFVLDCVDGKIARLNGTGSLFGCWLDYILDRLRVAACAVALFVGAYVETEELAYLATGAAVVFLDMFRYLNSLQIFRINSDMQARLAEIRPAASVEHDDAAIEAIDTAPAFGDRSMMRVGGHRSLTVRAFLILRRRLQQSRIRPHLISGIEFQMGVFIVAPLTAAALGTSVLIGVTGVAAAGLVAFELALIYMLYTATTAASREVARYEAQVRTPQPRAGAEIDAGLPVR